MSITIKGRAVAALAAVAAALTFTVSAARADAVADFYRGRTVTILVPAAAGGVYGTFALFLQNHMPRHIPGNPKVVLNIMTGAGGTKAMNYLYAAAPKDGTVVATPLTGVVTTPVLRPKAVRYDPTKLHWLGGWGEAVVVMSLFHTAPVKTFQETLKKEVILGTIGKGTSSYQVPALLNTMLGTKFKLITGYRGGSPIRLAIEKGEIHGWAGLWLGWKARKPEWVRENKLVHLFQIASKRSRDLPNVPLLTEFAQNDEQKKIFTFLSSAGLTARAMVLPPGVPAERVAALEKAYMATLRDPAFVAEAAKRKYTIDPVTSKEVTAAMMRLVSLPPDLLAKTKAAMGFK